jgi:hypothetical protein
MKALVVAIAVSLVVLAAPGSFAYADEGAEEKPYFHASQKQTVTAVVEAINHETREVTVRDSQGQSQSFVASKDARNLGQVQVGDIVHAELLNSLTVEVFANEGMEPDAAKGAAIARTAEGEMPGVAAMDTTVIRATVEEINIEANTFKLRGPRGNVQEYSARNPDNLKRAKVGDLVIITVTNAMAITVEERAAE